MQYIVLDMEWNQPWPGSPAAKKKLPIHGEIMQIGAVRMVDGKARDEFQILIRPNFYKKVNRKVSSLTGLKEAALKQHGVGFPEAIAQFCAWCGENAGFFTWGYDDIPLLRENLAIYDLDAQWVGQWYNAQLIFNAQTDGAHTQKALKTAMEQLGIESSRPAHDALGDAYHTARVLEKLDLERGVREYGKTRKDHEEGVQGSELPGCLSRKVYHGFTDKNQALAQISGKQTSCPKCGAPMQAGRWYSQQGRRYVCMASCPDHGSFLVRVRLAQEDDKLRAIQLIYDGQSETAKSCQCLLQKARRRLHRKRSPKPAKSPEQREA